MKEHKELSDHLLDLAELANKRLITRKEYIAYPIMAVGAGVTRFILPDGVYPDGVYGDAIRSLLSAITVSASITTGLLLGADLIREGITRGEIDQIKKAKQQ